MVKVKIDLEKIYLIIIFSALIWVGCAVLWDYKIMHDFPYGYMASDTFQHQTRVEGIKEMGNYRNEAFHIVAGFKDVIGYYPPIMSHLGVVFSIVSGLETYDGAYFLIFFFSAIAALIMYLIIRNYNKLVAVLAVPLSALIFSQALYTGFTWGHWPSLLTQFFLVAVFWVITRIDMKGSSSLLIIIFSAVILSHIPGAIFGILFIVLYFGYKFLVKRLKLSELRRVIIGLVFAFIISLHYLIIFKFTWAKYQPYRFNIAREFGGTLTFFLKDFGVILLILMGIGFIIGLMLLRKKKSGAVIIGIIMFLIGYGNYYGFGNRAFQARFFWPIYLSIFFGLGVYHVIKLFTKKHYYYFGIALIFLLIFNTSFIAAIPSTARFTSPGIMNSYHWDALQWIRFNTPIESRVLFFYGDGYEQDAILRNTHREHYLVVPKDIVRHINNKTIGRYYEIEQPSERSARGPYRKSLFKFGYHYEENDYKRTIVRDICNFDYYIFDKASREPVLIQYNVLIANKLMENEFIEGIYSNDLVTILKNNKPGDDCIVEQTFE